MKSIADLLVLATIAFALIAGAIMVWYLIRQPALTAATKLALLAGIFVFPLLSAMSGNVSGYETTQKRHFCGGCHVMLPYTDDAENPNSTSLASLHARNELFGDRNCYRCHEDYAMFGAVTTKATGLVHAYHYVKSYWSMPAEDALGKMHLYNPYPNSNCMHCHSTQLPGFVELADHKGALESIREGKESCVSSGCHGPVHPFSKKEEEVAQP
ncbi:MAG: hypothetical protein RIT81_00030 [Deltaproteobacteria bacterium]